MLIKPQILQYTAGDMLIVFSGSNPMTKAQIGMESDVHQHRDYELYCVVDGELEFITDRTIRMRGGDLTLIPKNCMHACLSGDYRRFVVSFDIRREGESTGGYSEYEDYHALLESITEPVFFRNEELLSLVVSILALDGSASSIHKLRIYLSMIFLLGMENLRKILPQSTSQLCQAEELSPNADKEREWLIETFLSNQYSTPHLTLEMLSDELGLSRRQTDRTIRRLFGESFQTLLLKQRMDVAERLITQTSIPMNEIAQKVGYDSYSGFYLAVRGYFGVAPDSIRADRDTVKQREK